VHRATLTPDFSDLKISSSRRGSTPDISG